MATSSSFTSRFPESRFRVNIRNAMKMGMPENDAEKVSWWWKRVREYDPQDPAHNPYTWDQPTVVDAIGNPDLADPGGGADQSVIVDYTIEFKSRPAGSVTTVLGEIDTSRAIITIFDTDYETIKTADYAKVGSNVYRIQFVEPAIGMFGVSMYTIVLEAEDQASA